MVYYMDMIMVNIAEVKARLSELLDQVTAGDTVVICKRNQPVAEITAVAPARREPRPLGQAIGQVEVPGSFFEPLPADLLEAFAGGGTRGTSVRSLSGADRVADGPAPPPDERPPRLRTTGFAQRPPRKRR